MLAEPPQKSHRTTATYTGSEMLSDASASRSDSRREPGGLIWLRAQRPASADVRHEVATDVVLIWEARLFLSKLQCPRIYGAKGI
jgi:hypothetical protein